MRRHESLIVGRMQAHGRAPYQFRRGEDPSYYLKVMTSRGERILWGKDLERAIAKAATGPKIGDLIGARRMSQEPVTFTAHQRNRDGHIVGQSERHVHRNRWLVEKVQFFAERAKLARRVRDDHTETRRTVKRHPELASTYLSLRGARLIAERRIANPEDREHFIALVREAMTASIHSGDPLPAIRMREQTKDPAPKSPPVRGGPRDNEPTR